MQRHELNKDWFLELDPANPASTLKIARNDGKFFSVRFNSNKWGQPVLEEVAGADGYAGSVVAVVAKIDEGWHVLVARVDRPADDFQNKLIEGVRQSVSNADPHLTASGLPISWHSGHGHANSARIADKLRLGVAQVNAAEFQLPANAEWMSFADFFKQSTDMMTKAVLGQFMCEELATVALTFQ